MALSLTEKIMYATIRIECDYKDGNQGLGTGFIVQLKLNQETGTHIPIVITNKHVIENAVTGRFIFCKGDGKGNPIDLEQHQIVYNKFEQAWRKHPDSDVDLCALPLEPILEDARDKKMNLHFTYIDKSLFPSDEQLAELSPIEEVLMVGYPIGIWDQVNNKPIFRRGITATHPAKDYNGKKEFLIDAACFPGSSGSPVFIVNEGGYKDKMGIMYVGGSRVFLLGTLYAGPVLDTKGEIEIINVPTKSIPVPVTKIPVNLGIIIKSERILELEALFPDYLYIDR